MVKGLFLLLVFLIIIVGITALIEAPDGSVCFNQCSGHGDCIDYSCHCHVGYTGDDCSTTFVTDKENIIPILGAGHFNVTRQNFTQTVSKYKHLLVGFSSYSCHKCIRSESEYKLIEDKMLEKKIPFARGNADKMKSIALELGAMDLPSLVFFNKMKPVVYKGVHNANSVMQYVNKQLDPPVTKIKTLEEMEAFKNRRFKAEYSVSTVIVIGIFTDYQDIEEDEYQEFLDVAKELQSNEDIYFGVIQNNASLVNFLKKNKTIDRTPSVYVISSDIDTPFTINLDELYGEKGGLKEWILSHSIPLVGRMTPQNFLLYEKMNLPMLLMFLNLTNEQQLSSQPGRVVGGRSGGIINELLIEELKVAAKEHVGRILCVYLDGTLYEDQMKLLGLYGGKERLPSLAFNTRDGSQIPFPEELPINSESLLQFMANFISGKLRNIDDTKEMAKKALQRAIPISQKNKATRLEKKEPPKVVQGVSEQFGDGLKGDTAVMQITLKNFDETVLNEEFEKDIVLLLYSKNCEPCSHFNVYYKRMADRFKELNIPSVAIARMDVDTDTPPAHMNMINGPLPLVLIVPAHAKYPPWNYFSGVGKVQPLMKWIHEHASIPFELENLPHLSAKDKIAYKEQVREREIALEEKRKEEKRQMEREEYERKEILRKRRKQEKLKEQGQEQSQEQESEEETVKVKDTNSKSQSPESRPNKIILEDHDEF